MPFAFTFAHKLLFGFILVGVLCGVSWFHGYSTASARLQRASTKAFTEALEEAKKQGEQDKRLAEKATRQLNEKKEELDEILNREIPTDPDCVLAPDSERLRQLESLSNATKLD